MGYIESGLNTIFYNKSNIGEKSFEDFIKFFMKEKRYHLFTLEKFKKKNLIDKLRKLFNTNNEEIIIIKIDKKFDYYDFKEALKGYSYEDKFILLFKEANDNTTDILNYSYSIFKNASKVDIKENLIKGGNVENNILICDSKVVLIMEPNHNNRYYILKVRESCKRNSKGTIADLWTNRLFMLTWYNYISQSTNTTLAKTINIDNAKLICDMEQCTFTNRVCDIDDVRELELTDFITLNEAFKIYGEKYEEKGYI